MDAGSIPFYIMEHSHLFVLFCQFTAMTLYFLYKYIFVTSQKKAKILLIHLAFQNNKKKMYSRETESKTLLFYTLLFCVQSSLQNK